MNKPTDIYLTEEVGQFAKKNPNFNITDLQNEAVFFIIGVLFVFAAYTLAKAGLTKMWSASIGSHAESNEKIKAFGVSLVVIVVTMSLLSYLGVFSSDYSLKPLSSSPSSQPSLGTVPTPAHAPTGFSDQNLVAMLETEAKNREFLESFQGIQINKKACTAIGQTNCTSVGGMGAGTLAMLESLKRVCTCNFVITGGTEWWTHSTATRHRPGQSTAVDLSFGNKNSGVSKFIYESPLFKGSDKVWPRCYTAFIWSGFYFCDEKDNGSQPRHWHIQPL